MLKQIKNNVFWIGQTDWEIRQFHGHEYSTHKGTSYNSYLIREGKTVVIDTVSKPFAKDFVANLEKELGDLNKIDYVVANHAEPDHSGALAELMARIPGKPVYCTFAATMSLKGHYHQDWNFQVVKTGDKLDLGNGKELVFVEAPMLHWPDSMFCYLTGENILFSNDAFGQHYATEFLFNDLVNQEELFNESLKYYANILTPFATFVRRKIDEFKGLNLPLDIICPSHGVIWRHEPMKIIEKYYEWAGDYRQNQITIIYDTMWGSTRLMAEEIANGIKRGDPNVEIKIYNISTGDKNDIITEIFKSKGILVGSPTINRGILSGVAGILEEIRGLSFKGKKASAFGSFGWSGESGMMIEELLKKAGMEIVKEPLRFMWNPTKEQRDICHEFGGDFSRKF